MKKLTTAIISKLTENFTDVTFSEETDTATINAYSNTFTLTATEDSYTVNDTICKDMKAVYKHINSFKPVEVKTEEVAPEQKKEDVVFYKLSTGEIPSLSVMKLNVSLANVIDTEYFKRGLASSMWSKYIAKIEDQISKLTDNINESEDEEIILALQTKKESLSEFKSDMIVKRDALGITEEEETAFLADKFLELVSYAVFKGTAPELSGKYNLMTILENIKNIRYSGKECNLSTLKQALNDIALDFATVADATGHYRNSRINVNSTMTEQVWQVYFRGTKLNKEGNFTNNNFAKQPAILKEVISQIVGKLQKSIAITD